MNLKYLTKSPYLKHPIWYLGTVKNTKCNVANDYGFKLNEGTEKHIPKSFTKSKAQNIGSITKYQYVLFILYLILHRFNSD